MELLKRMRYSAWSTAAAPVLLVWMMFYDRALL
jgi:hypothetical protein